METITQPTPTNEPNVFYRLAEELDAYREHQTPCFASYLEQVVKIFLSEKDLKNKAFSVLTDNGLYDEFHNRTNNR